MSHFSTRAGLAFPASLSEKYRPHSLQDFVGLDKPKKVLQKFAENPFPNASFLFVGLSGTGNLRDAVEQSTGGNSCSLDAAGGPSSGLQDAPSIENGDNMKAKNKIDGRVR